MIIVKPKSINTANLKLPYNESTQLDTTIINFPNIQIAINFNDKKELATCYINSIKLNPDILKQVYLKKIKEYEKKFGKSSEEIYLEHNSNNNSISDPIIYDWITTYRKYLQMCKKE